MNIEDIREYAISYPDVEEGFPFGDSVLVCKVKGKIFLLLSLDASPLQFNVKCDPEIALELREQHAAVIPGYHMNKKHWNTIIVDGSMSNKLVKEMIDMSYNLVAKTKTTRKNLK